MRPVSYKIKLEEKEQLCLKKFIRKQTNPQNEVKRAKIILLANEQVMSHQQIAKNLAIDPSDITRWTKRWEERSDDPIEERKKTYLVQAHPAELLQSSGVASWR